MTTSFTIDELPIPASADATEYADFAEMVQNRNEIKASPRAGSAFPVEHRRVWEHCRD